MAEGLIVEGSRVTIPWIMAQMSPVVRDIWSRAGGRAQSNRRGSAGHVVERGLAPPVGVVEQAPSPLGHGASAHQPAG